MQGFPYTHYVPLAAAVIALALAVFLSIRGARRAATGGFAATFVLLGVQELAVFMALRPEDGGVSIAGFRVAVAARLLLPIPCLVFGLTFAEGEDRRRLRAWAPVLIGLGGLALASIALMSSPAMFSAVPLVGFPRDMVVAGDLGKGALILALLGSVAALVVLESLLRQASGDARHRIKHLLLGLFAAFAAEVYAVSRTLLFSSVDAGPLLTEAAGLLVATVFIALTVVRHRLFQVNIYVSRQVVYRSTAVALVGGYLLALGLAGEAFRQFDIPMQDFFLGAGAFMALLALGVAAFSERLRRRVKLYIDTHFYRHKHDYRRRWVEFTHSLGPVVRMEDLLPRLLNTLMQTLWVEQAAVYLADGRGTELVLAHAVGPRHLPDRIPSEATGAAGREASQAIDLATTDGAAAAARSAGFVLLAPMQGPDGLVGALAVGPELTGKPFTAEDRDLLATIAAQAATAILTVRLSQDLAAAKGMEALHRVAAFLLHDLKNCTSVLTMVAENAREHIGRPEFQRDALAAISASAVKMRQLIARLSGLPREPETERESADVAEVVEEVLSEFRKGLRPEVALKLDLRPTPPVLCDSTQIGRVVTNLLVNAAEAVVDGGKLSVETFSEGAWAGIRVRDTGRGIPEATLRNGLFQPFRSTKPGGLGVGLYQCKTIVEAHGGRIEVESREGVGTTFTVLLPLASESTQHSAISRQHPCQEPED